MKTFAPVASALRASLLLCALFASACTPVITQVRSRPLTVTTGAHGKTSLNDMTLATSALQNGDISLATSMFGKVLETQPHNLEALTGMASALAQSGDLERARGMYERAAAIAPEHTVPMIGLARIAVRQRRLDEAIALYQRVLSREPSNVLACAGLGTAWALKGDAHRAQSIYRDALQRHPGDMMLTIDLGLSLVLDGQVREGANLLLSVAGEPGAPVQARQDLALAYGLLGNSGAADKILMRDLPRGSTDDNLRFYKVVRARLDAGQPNTPVAMVPTSRHIGVQAFAIKPLASAAVPMEPVVTSEPAAPVAMNTATVPAISAPTYKPAATARTLHTANRTVPGQPSAPVLRPSREPLESMMPLAATQPSASEPPQQLARQALQPALEPAGLQPSFAATKDATIAPALPPLGLRGQTPLLDAQ